MPGFLRVLGVLSAKLVFDVGSKWYAERASTAVRTENAEHTEKNEAGKKDQSLFDLFFPVNFVLSVAGF